MNKIIKLQFWAPCALFFACLLAASCSVEDPADHVFINGRVYTGNSSQPWAQAFAVRGKELVYVGGNEVPEGLVGDQTRRTDLEGRMVMSGIHDAHTHLLLAGWLQNYSCKLPGKFSVEQLIARLKACQARNESESDWIIGGLIFANQFPDGKPNRSLLDEHFPETPIFLHEGSLHHALVNSKALAIAGIDKSTRNPLGGEIVRDENGELTGELVEMATTFVSRIMPEPTAAESAAAIEWAVRKNAEYGITSVQDATGELKMLRVLSDMDKAGSLTMDVAVHVMWEAPKFNNMSTDAVNDLLAEREKYASAHVNPNNIKMWIDGSPTPPYFTQADYDIETDTPEWDRVLFSQEDLNDYVARFDRMQMRVKMHVAGAGATNVALNAIEYARSVNDQSRLRHELAHTNLVAPNDISRIHDLNVIAEMSPAVWHLYGKKLGDPPQDAWEFKKMLDADVVMTVGTDWAVTEDPNLFPGLAGMMTHGENSIDLASALQALTLNGAVAMGREDDLGSIEVGKHANFIVLDRLIFELPPEEVAETKVLKTFFEGELIYSAK